MHLKGATCENVVFFSLRKSLQVTIPAACRSPYRFAYRRAYRHKSLVSAMYESRAGRRRGLQLVLPFSSFFVFFGTCPIFPGIVRGFSQFVLVLFLGRRTAPTTFSPERVSNTIRTFPKKNVGPPRFTFSQVQKCCVLLGIVASFLHPTR